MLWKITAYNGTTWEAPYQMYLSAAIHFFKEGTGLCEYDIKHIENLH